MAQASKAFISLTILLAIITAVSAQETPPAGRIAEDPHVKTGGDDDKNAMYNWILFLLFLPGVVALIYSYLRNRKLRKQREEMNEDSPLLITMEDILVSENMESFQ